MKFKISKISQMSGISTSGIRFYEKAGVITPAREENSRYRDFSVNELQLILMCKIYRDSGFTLQESVDLINHADGEKIKKSTKMQYAKIKREIEEKQALLEYLGQKHKDMDCFLGDQPCYQVQQSPVLLRAKLWQPGRDANDHVPQNEIRVWMDRAPFVESCLLLSQDLFLNGTGALDTDWGIAIDIKYANRLQLSLPHKIDEIPSSKCVRTVIRINPDLTISSDELTGIRNYLIEHHFEPAGPAISRLFYAENRDGNFVRHDFLWVPIQ